jgi:chemotaxis signal transduction protein
VGLIAGEKPMKRLRKLVTFSLDDRAFALYVSAVIRIIRVVEITSLDNQEKLNHEKQTQA